MKFKLNDKVKYVGMEHVDILGKVGVVSSVLNLSAGYDYRIIIADYTWLVDEKDLELVSSAPEPVAVSTSSTQGVKHDAGKADLSMISKDLLEQIARVREFGAKKYARDNWRKGFKFTRSIAAALRHISAFNEGEDLDPESGLPHIAHAICCLEHLLNDYLNHPLNDDRYKKED